MTEPKEWVRGTLIDNQSVRPQVTIWPGNWYLKWGGDSLIGLSPSHVGWDATSRQTVSELNCRTPSWCQSIA